VPQPAGTPVSGGTLHLLAEGDPSYALDPILGYLGVGYELQRLLSRDLYTWPAAAAPGADVVPDLAIGYPAVNPSRTVYTVTMRPDVSWDTSPPRPVTPADVIRGVEMSCNPVQPAYDVGADLEKLVAGMAAFCDRFEHVRRTAAAMDAFLADHAISGVHRGSDGHQIVFQLTHPDNEFVDMLATPPFAPRPRELMRYLPGSREDVRHLVSDGPYRITKLTTPSDHQPYDVGRIVLDRNPRWRPEADPVRHAYVDRVVVRTGYLKHGGHEAVRMLQAGSADLCECQLDVGDVRQLFAAHDPHLRENPSIASYPFLMFNTVSPNNHGALRNADVRRAISYALDRAGLVRALGGAPFETPLTHPLPPGIIGSEQFDPYPYDLNQARALLAAAGAQHLHLALLHKYDVSSPSIDRLIQVLTDQLRALGIRVNLIDEASDYSDQRTVRNTRKGFWDLTIEGWEPDWPGNAAGPFFRGFLDGRVLPPTSQDHGLYDNPALSALIDRAEQAPLSDAAGLWHQAEQIAMRDAVIYPISVPNVLDYVPDRVHGYVYLPALQGPDLTNVWLNRPGHRP
jgi:peptide/nickel transport system substrate-binding protein